MKSIAMNENFVLKIDKNNVALRENLLFFRNLFIYKDTVVWFSFFRFSNIYLKLKNY